ncbi:hypothetical protein MMC24_003366 [Lignoscripta atroalba]|nr:hypothetical protein [Lignoscripta atroalba]
MEDQVNRLVKKAWGKHSRSRTVHRVIDKGIPEKYEQTPPSQRLLIAISGIPGSGKTTLASLVSSHLNAHHSDLSPGCSTELLAAFVPMDGYHLSRAQLSAMPDPTTAHARRGAAFTFDAPSFLRLVRQLREPLLPESKSLYAPSFDHAVKDPVQNDIAIPPSARIIIFEGNYLSLNKGEWKEAAGLMDELWFVEVEEGVARRRLVDRHVRSGVTADREEAEKRVSENDLVNGREIVEGRLEVDEVVLSKEDEAWRPGRQGVGV